uniref:Uncharacterized protein n=1 Tax=Ralstonia syzygii R24 TaxID=907261 RepID=G3AAT4_9RALS|nr:hypothetical protein RALSY_mp30828 [Ralstonia syzygii R24]
MRWIIMGDLFAPPGRRSIRAPEIHTERQPGGAGAGPLFAPRKPIFKRTPRGDSDTPAFLWV